jgi:hypothetical protein
MAKEEKKWILVNIQIHTGISIMYILYTNYILYIYIIIYNLYFNNVVIIFYIFYFHFSYSLLTFSITYILYK